MRYDENGRKATEALVEAYKRFHDWKVGLENATGITTVVWASVCDSLDRIVQAGDEIGFNVEREAHQP